MGTNERLLWRELGCRQPTAGRASRPLNGNGPVAFERSFNSDEGLIKRLSQTAELTGDAASVSNLSWSPDGQFLASGGEDCRITVWEPGMHQKKHTIDMGHTSTINSVRYLPSSNNEYIVTASNDKEVRLVNLVKRAVLPFKNHRGRVKSIAVLDPSVFTSAGEDGTVRQVDLRERSRSMTLMADQRQEKTGVVKSRVPINSIAVCPLHPHLFATGGGDAIVRLYDRRMCSGQGSKPHRTLWFAGYMPMHFKSTLIHRLRPVPPLRPNVHISGVSFSHDGRQLFASYTNEQIYSFSCKQHQRVAAYFEAPDPAAHATRSTARLHRPTARRWPTAALSQGTAEGGQPSAGGPAQQQQSGARLQGNAGAAQAASSARAAARGPGPGQRPLATVIATATQQFIERLQAVQPNDTMMRTMIREMAEEIHAQAPPAPGADEGAEGADAGPEQAVAPEQAELRRTASAPEPAGEPDVRMAANFAADLIMGLSAVFQPPQAEQGLDDAAQPQEAAAAQAGAELNARAAQGEPNAATEEGRQERARMLRQASRRGASRGRLVSRSGSVQAPLAQSIGRVAPGPAQGSPNPDEAAPATQQTHSQAVDSPVTRQATRRTGQPQQAARQAGVPALVAGVAEAAAAHRPSGTAAADADVQAQGHGQRRTRARDVKADAELAVNEPPSRRQRRAPVARGTVPALDGPSVPSNEPDAAATPAAEAQVNGVPRPIRQTASTLAAAGHAYAVAGRSAERPTASTGTSRPVPRPQGALKREEGSPDVPEQASGHVGQPGAFPVPLPRRAGSARAAAQQDDAAQMGQDHTAEQAQQEPEATTQRRARLRRARLSDRHSGAGSTPRRTVIMTINPTGEQQQTQPANAEASSDQPGTRQGRQRAARAAHPAAADVAPVPHQEAVKEDEAKEEGGRDGSANGRQGTAARVQRRGAPAAQAGPEPAEDVCCQRAQSIHTQDKSKSAASPPSVQRAPGGQPSGQRRAPQPADNATMPAPAAARSASERPAAAHAWEEAAPEQAGQRERRQASPQQAVIQDGGTPGPRRRQPMTGRGVRNGSNAQRRAEAPEAVSEVGAAAGPAPPPNEPAAGSAAQQQGPAAEHAVRRDVANPHPARSSPSSSAAAVDMSPQAGEEPDVMGPSAPQRAGEDRQQQQQQQGVDSLIGAIMDVSDADDGEVVEEDGMFDMVYSGHCNKQGCKEVSLIGNESEFVCSGSDGGSIFIWNAKSGQLVNVMRANDTVTTCVAPHPHVPMLASCGFEPAVRLWSPEAEEATQLEHAEEVMRQNALDLSQRADAQAAAAPQLFLNMGLLAPAPVLPMPAAQPAAELRLNRGDDTRDNAVRCSIM